MSLKMGPFLSVPTTTTSFQATLIFHPDSFLNGSLCLFLSPNSSVSALQPKQSFKMPTSNITPWLYAKAFLSALVQSEILIRPHRCLHPHPHSLGYPAALPPVTPSEALRPLPLPRLSTGQPGKPLLTLPNSSSTFTQLLVYLQPPKGDFPML